VALTQALAIMGEGGGMEVHALKDLHRWHG
jgi:hypothetical protein